MSSNTKRFLIPKKDTRVVNPETGKALPASGAHVRGNEIYWLRRLSDGDVTEGTEPKATRARSATNKPKASQE